jgi:UDP-3-O-[3-hydroxymyristoyl] glucosamine N-acyltransferase
VADTVLTAQAVADIVGGRLLGDGALEISRIGPLDRAERDTLSFLVSTSYLAYFRASRAGVVLVSPQLADEPEGPTTRIVVDDPYRAILALLPRMAKPMSAAEPEVHPTAIVGTGAVLGSDVSVGPHAVIGKNVVIGARSRIGAGVFLGDGVVTGEDCQLGTRVVCEEGTRLGDRVVLKSGAVIGGPGFGFLPSNSGHQRIPHIGACILESDVEIGSNSTIDRGSFDDTVIGRGSKIDNLVHIAHNVRIGARCLVMACSGIAGSSRLGDDVILAGGGGVSDHISIGPGARIGARSTVIGDVPPGATFTGYPARPHRDFLRGQAALSRLGPLVRQLEQLVTEREHRGQTND